MEEKKNLSVHIVYRNEKLMPVSDYMYSLDEYTQMIRNDMMRMITDVEDLVYEATGGLPKEKWADETWARFAKIKHKLLDKAGEVGRLPQCIVYGGVGDGTYLEQEEKRS